MDNLWRPSKNRRENSDCLRRATVELAWQYLNIQTELAAKNGYHLIYIFMLQACKLQKPKYLEHITVVMYILLSLVFYTAIQYAMDLLKLIANIKNQF